MSENNIDTISTPKDGAENEGDIDLNLVISKKYTEIDVYNRLILRRDAWSKQRLRPDEKGRFGYTKQDSELTDTLLQDSLDTDNISIGAYTVYPVTNLVVNPTIDIDNHDWKIDILSEVNTIFKAVRDAGMFPYIEASAGELKDGAHVGVICKPALASIAKTAIETIISATGLEHEVNPKQDTVDEGKYGNLVKLPFQFNNRTKARSQIINPETFKPFSREDAIEYMMALPDTVFPDVVEVADVEEEEFIHRVESVAKDACAPIAHIIPGATFAEQFKVTTLLCIEKCFNEKWALHAKPGAHDFRLAIAGNLIKEGVPDELVIAYFQDQKDFSRTITQTQIISTHQYLNTTGKPPMGCKRIKNMCKSIVGETCNRCPNSMPKGDFFTAKGRFIVSNLGDYILAQHDFITMMDNPQELYLYQGGVYTRISADMKIRTLATELLGERIKRSYVDETVYYIQTRSVVNREQINADDSKINLKNGLYNIKTRKLEPHTPEFLSTQQIPVIYDRDAKCPVISKFLLEILPIEEAALILQLIGYLMIPNRDIQKAFMFTGGGSNGKGTVTRLIESFLGKINYSLVSLQNLNDDRFAVADLYGKLANIAPDLASDKIDEDAVFKAITGKDGLRGQRKYEKPFDFNPIARLVFSANDLPKHEKGGYAWNRRWIIINFTKKFEGKDDDTELDAKLATQNELSGLLNLTLDALHWLQKTNRYFYSKTVEEVGLEYKLKSDPLEVFLAECTVQSDEYIATGVLYEVYEKWGKYHKLNKIIAHNIFGQQLKKKGFVPYRPYDDGGKRASAGFQGFSLNLDMRDFDIKSDKRSEVPFEPCLRHEPCLEPCLKEGVCDLGVSKNTNSQGLGYFTNYTNRNGKFLYCVDEKEGGALRKIPVTELMYLDNYTKLMRFVGWNPVYPVQDSEPEENAGKIRQDEKYKIVIPTDIQKTKTFQTTQLTKNIEEQSKVFCQMKGIVNTSNIEDFSQWFVDTCKPQWQTEGQSGYYTPSAIKNIASKILHLTPSSQA